MRSWRRRAAPAVRCRVLVARWNTWRLANLVLGLLALAALVVAHRSAMVVSESAAGSTSHHRRLLLLLGTATLLRGLRSLHPRPRLLYIAQGPGHRRRRRHGTGREGRRRGALGAVGDSRGALLAIPLCLMADRAGRRGILLLTVLGYTAATALPASRGPRDLIALQLVATMFLPPSRAGAGVIAEEFPAERRGRGRGCWGLARSVRGWRRRHCSRDGRTRARLARALLRRHRPAPVGGYLWWSTAEDPPLVKQLTTRNDPPRSGVCSRCCVPAAGRFLVLVTVAARRRRPRSARRSGSRRTAPPTRSAGRPRRSARSF